MRFSLTYSLVNFNKIQIFTKDGLRFCFVNFHISIIKLSFNNIQNSYSTGSVFKANVINVKIYSIWTDKNQKDHNPPNTFKLL